MRLFLTSWWSEFYKRPLKDPLLGEYTLEELAYEYYNHIERRKADSEAIQAENDKIEEAKEAEAEKWADDMEKEEAEEATKATAAPSDPRQDPSNKKWMEEQIRINKEQLGEDFGENLSLDFEND